MDRQIIYAGQIPLETDLLNTNKNMMVALAKLAAAMLGTATVVNGLACVPTGPASLTVNVNPGEMYSLISVDATQYSSLPVDTTHSILKQGIVLDAVNLSCAAPGTAGQSINYLIQATYQDSDAGSVVLPYYNASNPSQAWSGPGNNGTAQPTARKGIVTLSAKPGVAATTGSQTTPAADSGYTGLWVVTVANGQTQITAGNISQVAGAPILPSSILQSIQNGNLSYAVATGTANAHVIALTPALTARVDGMLVRYKAPAANTGALTLNDGLGAVSVVGANHAALQGGETVANGDALVMWNNSIGGGSYILIECTGGALQVAPATQSQHAMQYGQAVGRLLNVRVFTSSTTYTPTPGTNSVVVEGVGAGAAGGGTPASGGGNAAVGGGGGAGAYGRKRITSGFSGVAITIGAGGVGSAGATGGNGGTTSFGSLLSLPGGVGGLVGSAVAAANINSSGGGSNAPTGADVGYLGESGTPGITYSSSVALSGRGGISPLGSSGASIGSNGSSVNTGVSATGYGAGGGGALGVASGVSAAGGNGAPGLIIVSEYA